MIQKQIVEIAESFLGQEEIRGNMGFKDSRFEELMRSVGWRKEQAWCVYFAELVWRLAYAETNSVIEANVSKLFSGSGMVTFKNFRDAGFEITDFPELGSVVIWQHYRGGNPHWTSHVGIVVGVGAKNFQTVEGNTNDDGSREGFKVAKRVRAKETLVGQSSLILKGFIKAIEP